MECDLSLSPVRSKCSVRAMRVIIKAGGASEEPATVNGESERLDARRLEASGGDTVARGIPILRGFLSNLSGEDSPFSVIGHRLWSEGSNSNSESIVFASEVEIAISQGAQQLDRLQYEDFASGVAKLLEREPGEALCVELQITSVRFPDGRQGPILRLSLVARAAGRDQAQLRWSLGLARVQQALLFEARAPRQGRF